MELNQRTMLMVVFLIMGSALVQSQSSDGMCTEQQEIITVVDGSDSIYEEDFEKLKTALIGLTGNLSLNLGGQRFGVVLYSSSVSATIPLSNNSQTLSSEISKLTQPMEGTSTHLGILEMNTMMDDNGRPGVPKVGIVITDGRSFNRTATQVAAAQSRASGIIMFAVGVGPAVKSTELSNIASSEDRVFMLTDFDDLLANIARLVKEVCIVNGNWSEWTTNEGPCSVTCGGGQKYIMQSRTCDNPPPSNSGKFCDGISTQSYTETCNVVACPVNGNWSEWTTTNEGPCSVTCGGGERNIMQSRTCDNPPPSNGGKFCDGISTQSYTETCNVVACPVNGNWSEWTTTNEGPCSVTCGGGERNIMQSRTCDNPPPSNGGKFCDGISTQSYTETCNVVACPVSANPCDGCKWVNGIGYNPYTADCSKYIQCLNNGLIHYIMPCAPGTHWNQTELTCTSGKCYNSPLVTGEPGNSTDEQCTLLAVEGNNKIYLQQVPGQEPTQMQCSLGTVFDIAACTCVHDSNPLESPVCEAELDLNFDSDFKDHSGNGISIQNLNVTRIGGNYASFSSNSGIRILRFSNMDFRDTLIISFLFHAGQTTSLNQAIVSNADCGLEGSIYIIQTPAQIVFRVRNTTNNLISLSVAYSATPTHRSSRATPDVSVSLVVHQGSMKASVGSKMKTTPFPGNIAKSQCAMQIGRGTGFDHFIGDLDDFRVFLCMPEDNGYLP